MIVMDNGDGLWGLVRRILGWDRPPPPAGPPTENTADQKRVIDASKEVTKRAERAEKIVKQFTDKQQQELDALRERVRFYERRGE